MIFKIQAIEGINEVNTHYLEVVNARYQAEEFYRGGSGEGGVKMEVEASQSTSLLSGAPGGMKEGRTQAVYKAIQLTGESNPERGANRHDLYTKFPHITQTEMDKIIENLLEDGHIYSTVDSDNFLACF